MSKALEAAPLRDKLLLAISEVHSGCGAEGERIVDAVLSVIAQLAEDEAVVVAVGKAANQAWHVWLVESMNTSSQLDVAKKTPAHAAGIAALRTLAGKE